MKNKKSIMTFIFATVFTLNVMSVLAIDYGQELKNAPEKEYPQSFVDVSPDYWANDYIGEMVSRGVLDGYPNGKFYPDKSVTRAEFAKIMTVAAGIKISSAPQKIFSDVEQTDWFAPYVEAAYPYLSGYAINNSSYYQPSMPALREDIAVALVKLKGYDTAGYDESVLTTMFSDAYSISAAARPYAATAVQRGLVSGYEDDTFRGQQGITRAEAAALLWRAYRYGNDNKAFGDVSQTPSTNNPTITPKASAEPTPSAMPEPTQPPVSTPEVTSTPEPIYEADYVASMIVTDKIKYHCYDSKRNLVYFNIENDRYIKSFNPQTEEVVNVLSLDEFKYYTDDGYYKNAVISNSSPASPLLYDALNDRLYIRVGYKSFIDPNDYEPSDKLIGMAVLYDLRSGEYTQTSKTVTPLFFLTKDKYISYRQMCEASLDESVYDNYEKNYQIGESSQAIYKDGKAYYIYKNGEYYHGFWVYDLATGKNEQREIKKTFKDTWTNDGESFYFVSDKNEIIKYELNGKMTKLLDLNDVENKDYRGFTGKLYKCSNNRYCFVGDDGLKFIKKVN